MDIESETNRNEAKPFVKTLEMVFRDEVDANGCSLIMNLMTEPTEKAIRKNPMLLSPIIRCVLQFLNNKDIKNCRLVSCEWGSTGKLVLANRGLIHLYDDRLPVDFHSCFGNSANLFSAFKISQFPTKTYFSDGWTIGEINKFFDEHQKYIKDLTLDFDDDDEFEENIEIGTWISKSPMVQKDAKHMTKLSIKEYGDGIEESLDIPLHLIAHIKDLTLCDCGIKLEAGIRICPIKLELQNVMFFQNGIMRDRVLINDIVDFYKLQEVILFSMIFDPDDSTRNYVVDLSGNVTLKKLILQDCEIVNGELSEWVTEHLATIGIPYSLNSQMQIQEFYLSHPGNVDLFTLPNSVRKLTINISKSGGTIICSQPIILKNLEYLYLFGTESKSACSFLSHFMNCPQLTHLKLNQCGEMEMNSCRMPKSVKTLTLEDSTINWLEETSWNLDKLFLCWSFRCTVANQFFKSKIKVEDVVMIGNFLIMNKSLDHLLEYRNRVRFGKRLFIGDLEWGERKFEDSGLKEHVDVKSSCYVFENGEKGRAISENTFYDLADIPVHFEVEEYDNVFT